MEPILNFHRNKTVHCTSVCPAKRTEESASKEAERVTKLKAILLTHAVGVDRYAQNALWGCGLKTPRMVRSGMSGGLEYYLIWRTHRIAVSSTYRTRDISSCKILLTYKDGFYLTDQSGKFVANVEFLPEPSYYSQKTISGKTMASIAQQCFSKLAIGVFGACSFNSTTELACAFCAIHAARMTDSLVKNDVDIINTVSAVIDSELEKVIKIVMLGGGTPASPDRGATRFAALSSKLSKITPWRVTVMMAPPALDEDMQRLYDNGVKEISINLEFGSNEAFEHFTPGKAKIVGKKRYLQCLESAVKIFGEGNVQSLLVAGLEPIESTLQAVAWLAERKILPVLSPFRPLPRTILEDYAPSPIDELYDLYIQAKKIASHYGVFLGPRCAPCQCNTMTMPWDVPDSSLC